MNETMSRTTTRARRSLAAALLGAGALLGFAAAASAQYYDRDIDAVLPPRAIVWQLSRQGFTPLDRPRFDGVSYTVEAQSPWGNRVRLFIDARSGAIVDRERVEVPLYPPGRVGPGPGYGWTEEEVVRAPRPDPRYGRVAPQGVPSNPFASNYPSRAPAPAEARAIAPGPSSLGAPNPNGLNPDRGTAAAPNREERRAPPRRTAKLAPPKAAPTTAVSPAAVPAPDAVPVSPPSQASIKPAEIKPADAVPTRATLAPAAAPVAEAPPPKREVRIIGGVTPVPGGATAPDKTPDAPKPATPADSPTE